MNNPSKQKFDNNEVLAAVPTSFNIGASYQASDKILIATTIAKMPNLATDVRLGFDYKLIDLLSLRAGLSTKPFKQHAGFGISYKSFAMDMATRYDTNLGYAPQIAVGYAF